MSEARGSSGSPSSHDPNARPVFLPPQEPAAPPAPHNAAAPNPAGGPRITSPAGIVAASDPPGDTGPRDATAAVPPPRWALLAVGGAILALSIGIVVVLALLIAQKPPPAAPAALGSSTPAAPPTVAPSPPPTPSAHPPARQRGLPDFPGTPSRVLGRVYDQAAGISYARLSPPWRLEPPLAAPDEFHLVQDFVTEVYGTGGDQWIASVMSGSLDPQMFAAYHGRDRVFQAALAESRSVEGRFYPPRHTRAEIASQQLTVDGRPGWLVAYRLGFREPGLRATSEVMMVVAVDTGRDSPAVLWASIPDTHARMWPDLNLLVKSLQIIR